MESYSNYGNYTSKTKPQPQLQYGEDANVCICSRLTPSHHQFYWSREAVTLALDMCNYSTPVEPLYSPIWITYHILGVNWQGSHRWCNSPLPSMHSFWFWLNELTDIWKPGLLRDSSELMFYWALIFPALYSLLRPGLLTAGSSGYWKITMTYELMETWQIWSDCRWIVINLDWGWWTSGLMV